MKNTLNRNVLEGYKPFISSNEYKNHNRVLTQEKSINNQIKFLNSIEKVLQRIRK